MKDFLPLALFFFFFFLSIQRRERVGAVLVGLGRKGMGSIVSVRTMGRGGAIINDERWITKYGIDSGRSIQLSDR